MTPVPKSFTLPPVLHRMLDAQGLRIHCAEIDGPGRPLVLLHGIGMDWRVWQAVSRRLAPYFHLYMLDLRGHGTSDKPAHGYTLAHYAADVEDVVDALALAGVVLVGSSLGGMVAATVEAPVDVIGHRILVDPPLTGGPIRDAEMFRQIHRLKHESVAALAEYLRLSNPGAGQFYLRVMSEMWHEAADGVIEDMLAEPADYYEITSALEGNESPTLIMRADPRHGGVLSAGEAARAKDLLPHGCVLDVPGVGHAIHALAAEYFVSTLSGFVEPHRD